jgi:hypothetical protein
VAVGVVGCPALHVFGEPDGSGAESGLWLREVGSADEPVGLLAADAQEVGDFGGADEVVRHGG